MDKKDILKKEKVKLFEEASRSYNWTSGYRMGEVVKILAITDKTEEIIVHDRREYYSSRCKYEALHGMLTLIVDMRGHRTKYSVQEVSARGKKTFNWDCSTKRGIDIKKKLLNGRNVSDFIGSLNLKFKPECFMESKRDNVVGFDNYYRHTDVSFQVVDDSNTAYSTWENLKKDRSLKHHHSPCHNSISEYLENHSTGEIYRFSDHWGYGIASCNWFLAADSRDVVAVGVANLKDFVDRCAPLMYRLSESDIHILEEYADEDIKTIEQILKEYTCDNDALIILRDKISSINIKKASLRKYLEWTKP